MTDSNLPPLHEVLDRARVVSIPTRTRFRGVTAREAVIFEGAERWAEFSPFPEYDDAEAAAWLRAALEYGWGNLPAPRLTEVPINATVPAVDLASVERVLARFDGVATVKVKVAERGQSLADDVARVRLVRELMGPHALVRIDANAAWGLGEATRALDALAPFDLDYAEQPVAGIANLARLRNTFSGSVRIAADESVRKASDPLAVARAGAADLIVVKAQPLGGVRRALSLVTEAGLPVVVSSALDTSIGIAMGVHLAASLPGGMLYGACGLGTVELLEGDVCDTPLVPRAGVIPVGEAHAAPALLGRWRAPANRTAWWRARLKRCYALLT